MEKRQNRTQSEAVRDAAHDGAYEGARDALRGAMAHEINHYRAMERLLRSYKKLKRQVHDLDGYGFIPPERSKSVTVAPPQGGVSARDYEDACEDARRARHESYERSLARFIELDSLVKLYEARPEFVVIRMYYFDEDAYGNERPDGERYKSFDEISEELSANGFQRSEKTLRKWRTSLIQEMAVTLFGKDAALSLENRNIRRQNAEQQTREEEKDETEDKTEG